MGLHYFHKSIEGVPSLSLALFFIFIVSLISRLLVSRKMPASFDVYGHICFAAAVRDQGCGPFGTVILGIVGASSYSQPFMWHWLVGFFDLKSVLRNQAWLNSVIDSFFIVVAYKITQWGGYEREVALYAAAIYLMTPMWFSSIAIGPRIAGFTPRLSSEVATNLFFMLCLFPLGLHYLTVVLIGSLLAAFILSSSKFGVQALLFLTPITSLAAGTELPMAAAVAGVALTVVASRGRFINQLRSQIMHLAWYCKENLKGKMHVSNRNNLRSLFKRSEPSLKLFLVRLIYRIVSENSYTAVMVKLPVIFLVVLGVLSEILAGKGMFFSPLVAPIVAACSVYVVVNLRPFLFLGEAERYLNHVGMFIAIYAAEYVVENRLELMLWALFVYGALYWAIEAFALDKLKPQHLQERKIADDRVIDDLLVLEPTVVLCYPYQVAGGVFRITFETPHKAIYCALTTKVFAQRFNAEYAADYPFVKLEKLDEMATEYGVGYVVLDRAELRARGLEHWAPTPRWTKRNIGGEIYDVYLRHDLRDKGNVASVGAF